MESKKKLYKPPVGFHFTVEFTGIKNAEDQRFQSVSGLSVDLETEEIAEGGENRFKHKIPVRTKYPNLVLKRGMYLSSDVIKWCTDALFKAEYNPLDITINLMTLEKPDEAQPQANNAKPLQTWSVINAFPVKWNVSDFNAEENKYVIETLELAYNYFKIL